MDLRWPSPVRGMVAAVRLLWSASAGHRLRPWRSPYLRWRVETYSGQSAATLTWKDFLRLALRERRQMLRFVRWLGEMQELSGNREP